MFVGMLIVVGPTMLYTKNPVSNAFGVTEPETLLNSARTSERATFPPGIVTGRCGHHSSRTVIELFAPMVSTFAARDANICTVAAPDTVMEPENVVSPVNIV